MLYLSACILKWELKIKKETKYRSICSLPRAVLGMFSCILSILVTTLVSLVVYHGKFMTRDSSLSIQHCSSKSRALFIIPFPFLTKSIIFCNLPRDLVLQQLKLFQDWTVIALSYQLSYNQACNPCFATVIAADLGFSEFASLPIEWEQHTQCGWNEKKNSMVAATMLSTQ